MKNISPIGVVILIILTITALVSCVCCFAAGEIKWGIILGIVTIILIIILFKYGEFDGSGVDENYWP